MKSNYKSNVVDSFPSIYQNRDYEKFNSHRASREHMSKLDKYINYDGRYSNYYVTNLWDQESKGSSLFEPEDLEREYKPIPNESFSFKKPTFERISSFPIGDARCFARKTAFYNRKTTVEQHYLDNFNANEINDGIDESLYEIDNLNDETELVYFGNEINYDDICKDFGDNSNDEIDIEINFNAMRSFDHKNDYVNKKSISFSNVDCYEQAKGEDESEQDESEEDNESQDVSTSTVEELVERQDRITAGQFVLDFRTPALNTGDGTDEYTLEPTEKSTGDKNDENKEHDHLDKFAVDFMKFSEKKDKSLTDERSKDRDTKIMFDEGSLFIEEMKEESEYKQKEKHEGFDRVDMKSEVSENLEQSPKTINEDVYEPDKISKVYDRAVVTYISKDKMFLITGTVEGFIHIWSFLQPYQSKEERDFHNTHFLEKQRRKSMFEEAEGEEDEDGEQQEFEQTTSLRKLGTLSWSHMSSNPDVSFKAHETEILSLDIKPKTFSKGKIDYVLVSTSFDKTVKVWRLSNLSHKLSPVVVEFDGIDGPNGKKNKNKEVKIDLIGFQEDPEDVFINAAFIPNTKDLIIVTRYGGTIEKFKLKHLNKKHKNEEITEDNMSSVLKVSGEEHYVTASMSTGCNYYAVGGPTGYVSIYDVETLNLLASFECRNKKGSNSRGKEVTGIEWNKKDDLILVTTSDSRIRLLLFYSDNSIGKGQEYNYNDNNHIDIVENEHNTGKQIIYLEKFKGHKNNNKRYKARFFGETEQIVICPSESGEIYMWPITNPIAHPNKIDGTDNIRSNLYDRLNEEVEVKNHRYLKIKTENKHLLENFNIYNVYEWTKLFKMIQDSSNSEVEDANDRGGCLLCRGEPKNENPNPDHDLLMVSSPNGSEIKYSPIDVRYFQKQPYNVKGITVK